jgi:hypothetical protein
MTQSHTTHFPSPSSPDFKAWYADYVGSDRAKAAEVAAVFRRAGARQQPSILLPIATHLPKPREHPGVARWNKLHRRSMLAVVDSAAELQFIQHLADGMASCGCNNHWADYLKHFTPPPDVLQNPKLYSVWAHNAHNAVNGRLGKPSITYEAAIKLHAIHVHTCATGMGDAITGLYAVCGLADATAAHIVYHTHSLDWLRAAGVTHLRVELVDQSHDGIDMQGGDERYTEVINHPVSRCQAYCDRLAEQLKMPTFAPKQPHHTRVLTKQIDHHRVVIAPFAAYESRSWPVAKWHELIAILWNEQSIRATVIGSENQRDRLSTFADVARVECGRDANDVVNLITRARCVVANDSGIAHLGGLLGVQTIAVHAGSLPHEYLFRFAPSVKSVIGREIHNDISKSAFRHRADHDVSALASVDVQKVFQQVTA